MNTPFSTSNVSVGPKSGLFKKGLYSIGLPAMLSLSLGIYFEVCSLNYLAIEATFTEGYTL